MGLLETLGQDHQEVLGLLERVRESIRLLTEGQTLAEAGGALRDFLTTWEEAIDYHFGGPGKGKNGELEGGRSPGRR